MKQDFEKCDRSYPTNPYDEVLPGVIWGRPEWVFSPAYWAELANVAEIDGELFAKPESLLEEIVFCLLGGYGVTAEMNCAAFVHLKSAGMFGAPWSHDAKEIESLLSAPLSVGSKQKRYRFPKQRAKRVSNALRVLDSVSLPDNDALALREALLDLEGIGPKTASWIVRNWTGSDEVAILDIHVHRAGIKMGIFSANSSLPRDYETMEKQFLSFAEKISVKASELDVLIWSNMRKAGYRRNLA